MIKAGDLTTFNLRINKDGGNTNYIVYRVTFFQSQSYNEIQNTFLLLLC